MEKKYVIGALAIVGVIALIAYYNKPKKNSQGFYGMNGSSYGMSGQYYK